MAGWNKTKAVEHLNAKAQASSTGHCARYTRQAIEAGGVTLGRTLYAKDYGPSLIAAGFVQLKVETTGYQAGDVVVIQGFTGTPEDHMAMFNGDAWVSDFTQRELYPGPGYRTNKPSYAVYRYGQP